MRHQDVVTTADDPNDDRLQGSHWNKDHIFLATTEPDDADVAENTAYPWMSLVDGSIMVKINFGGVIKTATLVPFSLIT